MSDPAIEALNEKVNELLLSLGLPLLACDPEEEEEFDDELTKLQLALLFPNLNEGEQCLIAAACFAVQGATLILNTSADSLSPEDATKHEAATRSLTHSTLPEVLRRIEESGLKTKLSDVQERVLADLLDVRFKPGD